MYTISININKNLNNSDVLSGSERKFYNKSTIHV